MDFFVNSNKNETIYIFMKVLKTFFLIAFCLVSYSLLSQEKEIIIEAQKLTDHIHMLKGQGGNIGVFIGEEGVFVIDDQFAHLTDKIVSKIRELSEEPITFLVNTHYHGDHVGGNENIAKLGTTIISHDNVRKRLAREPDRSGKMMPKDALPIITFNDELSLYINGEHILVFHLENAHTDGDSMLYFTQSNVLHTGDNFFNGRYPYIDLKSGGSVDGYIKAVKKALIVIDDETKIIPGHGELSTKKEYKDFLSMMEDLKATIQLEIDKGKTLDEVATNASLTKTYDDLGYSWGFINSEKIRRTFYNSLKK